MSVELYAEFFLRFFIIMALIISSILSLASLLRKRSKEYLFNLLILGFLSFTILWNIHQFCEIVFITIDSADSDAGLKLMSKTFALMASMFIFSIAVVRRKLRSI